MGRLLSSPSAATGETTTMKQQEDTEKRDAVVLQNVSDEIRAQRLRGVTHPDDAQASGVSSLYPHVDATWTHGLDPLCGTVAPFMDDFLQHTTTPSDVDWLGFARVLRDVRRTLHRFPETGFNEVRTQAFLRRFCEVVLKIPRENVRALAGTGLAVDVCVGNKTMSVSPTADNKPTMPVLAFRADMDALPIEETNDHLPYCSIYKKPTSGKGDGTGRKTCTSPPCSHCGGGAAAATTTTEADGDAQDGEIDGDVDGLAAHMCGHDGHMTVVLGLLALVVRQSHLLPSDSFVRFVFQPAEESPGGAKPMIDEGVLEHVDEVYGLHNAPFPLYSMHVKSGPVLSHAFEFWIDITGVGGHGSAPHTGVDPILVGAHVVTALQSIVSRSLSPADTAVVSVTQFHGGDTNNVIPSNVHLSGTIRDFAPTVTETIQRRMEQIAHATCLAFGATANVRFKEGYPVTENHSDETRLVQQVGVETGLLVSEAGLPATGSEDFSFFLQQRKGCFFFLGTKEERDSPKIRALHTNGMDFNDKVTPLGIRVFLGILQKRLECELVEVEALQKFQVAMEQVVG